jgi:predicted DNA-binding transcriptional regulator AlpA
MARRGRNKSPQKRLNDPGQLGLFDAVQGPPEDCPAALAARPKRSRGDRAPPASSTMPERAVVLSPRQAAQYLGVSVSTLKLWRAKKIGPKWTMRGARLVAYRPADLEKFLDDNSAKR